MHDAVAEKLRDDFSPEQISGRLKEDYPDDWGMRVSTETIYQALFLQARGELRTQLKLALRTGRAQRYRAGQPAPSRPGSPAWLALTHCLKPGAPGAEAVSQRVQLPYPTGGTPVERDD